MVFSNANADMFANTINFITPVYITFFATDFIIYQFVDLVPNVALFHAGVFEAARTIFANFEHGSLQG
jgi:hypothetical protein